jgi:LAO/AO transport system kinase
MRAIPSTEELSAGIRRGDRVMLGRAITLIESAAPAHQASADALMDAIQPYAPTNTLRIGITGAPGVGKSSFIEALGTLLTSRGHKVAVLAVDPSSPKSRGSILGDKTRMERLSADSSAFIRPSPAGDALGGVARKTRETIALVEVAGYDVVLIETVGVGQSETAVRRMTDAFVLLLMPGAGDELQGIKRGIVEMADLLVVNKADGDRLDAAQMARAHYANALHLFPARESGWTPKVLTCSSLDASGIEAVWDALLLFRDRVGESGFFESNRRQQTQYWFRDTLEQSVRDAVYNNPAFSAAVEDMEEGVMRGAVSPFVAARALVEGLHVQYGINNK